MKGLDILPYIYLYGEWIGMLIDAHCFLGLTPTWRPTCIGVVEGCLIVRHSASSARESAYAFASRYVPFHAVDGGIVTDGSMSLNSKSFEVIPLGPSLSELVFVQHTLKVGNNC